MTPEQPEFALFIREIVREMTAKAGQKCTAIRRIIVPQDQIDAVSQALIARLEKVVVGDPAQEGVKMGSPVNSEQRADVQEKVDQLAAGCRSPGRKSRSAGRRGVLPANPALCPQPDETPAVHATEAFGPVATLMPYRHADHAMQLARAGGGTAGTLVTADPALARQFISGAARAHGRIQILNEESAKSLPATVLRFRSSCTAVPDVQAAARSWVACVRSNTICSAPPFRAARPCWPPSANSGYAARRCMKIASHPFRKYFEELQPGDSSLTPRRTLTEADIVNFACLSGDHFYAHMDKIGAAESIFGERVVHGYFLISAAAGLFVDAGVGPVIANYGMENLRFIEPVKPGDTIQCA